MVDVVAHAAFPGFSGATHRKQESSSARRSGYPSSPSKRHTHTDARAREPLTPPEVQKLRKAARSLGRHGDRNATMILLAYRHGLRVSELIHPRWDQVDLEQGLLHVRRVKHGVPQIPPDLVVKSHGVDIIEVI